MDDSCFVYWILTFLLGAAFGGWLVSSKWLPNCYSKFFGDKLPETQTGRGSRADTSYLPWGSWTWISSPYMCDSCSAPYPVWSCQWSPLYIGSSKKWQCIACKHGSYPPIDFSDKRKHDLVGAGSDDDVNSMGDSVKWAKL